MGLREDIKQHLDANGLVTGAPGVLMGSCLYYHCLAELGQIDIRADRADFLELVTNHFPCCRGDDPEGVLSTAHVLVLPQIEDAFGTPGRGPGRPFWGLWVLWRSFARQTDIRAWLVIWLEIQSFNWRSPFAVLAVKRWERKLKEHFPAGMKDVVSEYLGEAHPIARHWPIVGGLAQR